MDGVEAPRFTALLFVILAATELKSCALLGLFRGHARSFKILGTLGNVKTKLLFQRTVKAVAAEQAVN